jgi:hypothetical protein
VPSLTGEPRARRPDGCDDCAADRDQHPVSWGGGLVPALAMGLVDSAWPPARADPLASGTRDGPRAPRAAAGRDRARGRPVRITG